MRSEIFPPNQVKYGSRRKYQFQKCLKKHTKMPVQSSSKQLLWKVKYTHWTICNAKLLLLCFFFSSLVINHASASCAICYKLYNLANFLGLGIFLQTWNSSADFLMHTKLSRNKMVFYGIVSTRCLQFH